MEASIAAADVLNACPAVWALNGCQAKRMEDGSEDDIDASGSQSTLADNKRPRTLAQRDSETSQASAASSTATLRVGAHISATLSRSPPGASSAQVDIPLRAQTLIGFQPGESVVVEELAIATKLATRYDCEEVLTKCTITLPLPKGMIAKDVHIVTDDCDSAVSIDCVPGAGESLPSGAIMNYLEGHASRLS